MNSRLLFACACAALALLQPAAAQRIVVRQKDAPALTAKPEADGNGTPDSVATLHWNNGESLPGVLVGATDDGLVWRSPFFNEPLELAWTTLHRVDQALPDRKPTDPFAFVLRDGSRVYGELTGLTASSVNIRSERHGDAVLRRSEVLSLWRLRGKKLVYAGPLGETGWSAAPNPRLDVEDTTPLETLGQVPTRRTGPGGSLVLPFWHRTLAHPVVLPDRAEVSFELHARDQPAFQLVLDGRDKKRLRIETWGNEVVLAAANDFQKVCELAPGEHGVRLRVCWDRLGRKCEVYTPTGTLLAEWVLPDVSEDNKPAVMLMNKGHELTLDSLRIREWDGQPLNATDSNGDRVELVDGRVVTGGVSALSDGALQVGSPGVGPAQTIALEEVDAITFSDDLPTTHPHTISLACADGTLLHGEVNGFQDGHARIKTAFTDEPLSTRIDDLRQLFVHAAPPADAPADPPLDSFDQIVVGDNTLHGHFVAVGSATPGWRAVGGRNAVAPAPAVVSEIVRAMPAESPSAATTSLIYTRLGDALPGVWRGLDRREVEFDSPLIEAKTLPLAQLQAVQLDASGKGPITGFDAAGWQVLKGERDAKTKPGSLKLSATTVVSHPGAAQEGDIRFSYDTENYSCLRVRLFCEGANSSRALNYLMMRSGNRLTSGLETAEGQFNDQHQAVVSNGSVPVRFAIDGKSVRCYVNDALTDTVWFPAARRTGTGLILEASSVWGNPVQPVALSKFSAVSPNGRSFLVSVNADAKAQALTVPRFRKDDPPRHALLANNGDVLRGEIVALTNTQIGFRLGLETLRIPRDRVAAMIVLQPPAAAPSVPTEADATRKLLERRVGLQTIYGNVGYHSLLSIVRQSVPELKYRVPPGTDTRRVQFHFDNQSVAEILDSICELFELRYHVEKGIVLLEPRGQIIAGDLVHRTYWLKTDPFAGHGSAADVLGAHDIPFPKGASAEWQEHTRSLEIVNTADNQEKAAALLANELGGVLGSPTHWLLLRNGGRIGLTVEKFEADAVVGSHPIYGRCRVPMADVCAVRNTLPEPTAAARAVNGWQTVFAPEPVLPQSGGENSELLGKDAPAFKLKMLDGREFDLAAEKGKVVVLDFWATWCGPCIKSLPGLIEAMGQFPESKIRLIGVNQAEAPEQVTRFLETRRWKLAVAMDAGQSVAKQYGVEGIPHTVIIGPDGKVAWVHTGAAPDADEEAAAVVKKLLAEPAEKPHEPQKNGPVSAGEPGSGSSEGTQYPNRSRRNDPAAAMSSDAPRHAT